MEEKSCHARGEGGSITHQMPDGGSSLASFSFARVFIGLKGKKESAFVKGFYFILFEKEDCGRYNDDLFNLGKN